MKYSWDNEKCAYNKSQLNHNNCTSGTDINQMATNIHYHCTQINISQKIVLHCIMIIYGDLIKIKHYYDSVYQRILMCFTEPRSSIETQQGFTKSYITGYYTISSFYYYINFNVFYICYYLIWGSIR